MQIKSFISGSKKIKLFIEDEPAPLILYNTVQGEGQEIIDEYKKVGSLPFSLATVSGLDWMRDLAPWNTPDDFPKDARCVGGANAYLSELTDQILPKVLSKLEVHPTSLIISGYSLAGLFALYSAYKTDLFDRIVCCSGSFWFPGFIDFVQEQTMLKKPERIYFSVGDKESKSRNQLFDSVEKNTRYLANFYRQKGIITDFVLNSGSHFNHHIKRVAKGIDWILK